MYRPRLRTRAGCIKCKTRRKKCDERHPSCTQCLKWNFACVWPNVTRQQGNTEASRGGEQPGLTTGEEHAEKALRRTHPGSFSAPEHPAFRYGPLWGLQERQAFDFFQVQTSNGMSGVFRVGREMDIWSRMLLQGAHRDPAIKHAVCALGALHLHEWKEPNNHQGQTHLLAVEQYNKAVQCTINSSRRDGMSVDTALTMCILFTLLERLVGEMKTAMGHLQAGIKLLGDAIIDPKGAAQDTQLSHQATYVPRATIMALLRRLERQLFELGQTRLECDVTWTPSFSMDIPAIFESLEDACVSFELFFNDAILLMHTTVWKQETKHQILKPAEAGSVSLLYVILTRWTSAFMSFLRTAKLDDVSTSAEEQSTIHTLHMCRLMLSISLAHYQTGDEMIFDKFVPVFAEAVEHGSAVVRAKKQSSELARPQSHVEDPSSPVSEPNSSVDRGSSTSCSPVSMKHSPPGTTQYIQMNRASRFVLTCSPFSPVPGLFTIAFRCRDPIIRRRAVQLLQEIDWCDAFWDSKISAKLGERLVQIEEHGYLAGQPYGGPEPLVARAEQIRPAARCEQVRCQFEKPDLFVFDYICISVREWVPGPEYWEKLDQDSFCEVGRIREKWIVTG